LARTVRLASSPPQPRRCGADEVQELSESQVAEEKARRKAASKKAGKDRTRKRNDEERETKRLQAETERAELEVLRQANLAALRLAAEHTPELLDELCKLDKECRDAACSKMHHCTKVSGAGGRRSCPRLLRGALSKDTRNGHSPRQLACDKCGEMSRASLKKRRASMTSEEKKASGGRKKSRGEKEPGTANPVDVLAAGYHLFLDTIRTNPAWSLLVPAAGSPEKRLYGCDFEFASTSTTDTAPSEWGHLVLLEACVIDPWSRVLLNEPANFVPPSYKLGPIK
jgi:hypothetical protein